MHTRLEMRRDRERSRDRARAALLGHAIGDSFGDAARTPDNHFLFGITMGFREGVAPGTDDTEFALLSARTLLEGKGDLTDDLVLAAWREHVLPLPELHRGGASEREAAENIRRGLVQPETGEFNAYSLSDGAAMRATPFGIVAAGDPENAARLAAIDARISHARDGIWGAEAVAVGVSVAMAGGSVNEVCRGAIDIAPRGSWLRRTLETAQDTIARHGSLEESWMPLHRLLSGEYKAAAPEAVAEAFAVFKLVEGDFRRGIIYGGNWGRDADTIAAIVGALCGAMNGTSSIPQEWIDKVRSAAGACLPFTKGIDVTVVADELAALI